jgi:GAF domain-containing protein
MGKEAAYFERLITGLQQAAELSREEAEPEAAVAHITRIARAVMGDLDAGKNPGALKPGERDFRVAGIFFATPKRDHLILFADHDFPAEQRHLRISIYDSRPGHTVRTGQPVIIPNTDHDTTFRQILKSARMGSAVYAPVVWDGQVLGMFNIAAQARNSFDRTDLQAGMLFANLAAATWVAKGGPAHLADVAARLGPWDEARREGTVPQAEDRTALEAELSSVLADLLRETGGSRSTLRLDDAMRRWSVETPCAEALTDGIPSLKSNRIIHHRSAATARWLERNKRTLVQPDLTNADPPAPHALVNVFNVRAQMLGPILRDDGHVLGWLSIHYVGAPRDLGAKELAAMDRAIARVVKLTGLGTAKAD